MSCFKMALPWVALITVSKLCHLFFYLFLYRFCLKYIEVVMYKDWSRLLLGLATRFCNFQWLSGAEWVKAMSFRKTSSKGSGVTLVCFLVASFSLWRKLLGGSLSGNGLQLIVIERFNLHFPYILRKVIKCFLFQWPWGFLDGSLKGTTWTPVELGPMSLDSEP